MSGIDWGNAPAWGALIVAGVGGWIALAQLRQQQRIIARELKRGAALEEARLRGQAEAVDLAWSAGNGQGTFIKVINSSHRPIRDLECKIVSEKDDGVIALPVRAGEMQLRKASGASTYIRRVTGGDRPKRPAGADALNVIGRDWTPPKDRVAAGEWCNVLRGGGIAGFLMLQPPGLGQKALVLFTDDAGLRWQLDNELHLERVIGES
jgi:hypothetical protein